MIDVEERARRAGEAARAEAHARVAQLGSPVPRPARPWSTLLAAAGIALVALLVVVAVSTGGDLWRPVIDPVVSDPADPGAGLPVPDVGDVVATQLADGTPVFVTQPEAGEVLVLGAVDPYWPSGLRTLLVYCRSDGLFQGPRIGSWLDQRGNWLGGPGRWGLTLYPSELTDDGRSVRVVGTTGTAPTRDAPRGEPGGAPGKGCLLGESTDTGSLVVHRPPSHVPSLDGAEIPADRWVWASLVLSGPVDRLVVCNADGTCGAGPIVATDIGRRPASFVPPTTFVALARSTGDGRVDLLMSAHGVLADPEQAWHPFDLADWD